MNLMDRLSDDEIIATATAVAGIKAPTPAADQFERWHGEIEPLDLSLGGSLDPALRQTAIDEALREFGPEGKWHYAPASARREAEQKVTARLNEASGRALHDAERWLMDRGDEITAAVQARQQHRDPVAVVAARDGSDPLRLATIAELRRLRRGPFLEKSSQASRGRVYVDAPTTLEQMIDNEIIEGLISDGIGPASTDASELEAATVLRRRIDAARAARIPPSATKLLESIAAARKACSRARQLHKIRPIAPERKW